MSVEFWLTSLIVVASPGTGVLFTLAAGLSRGARGSVIAALGCTLGTIPHMAAAITGVAAVLHTSAVAFGTLKYLGVAYLLYMAWTTFRDKGALVVEDGALPPSAWRTITSGVLMNLLNPKLTIFFFAFLPQFVAPGDPNGLWLMLQLSLAFMLVTFVVFAAYGMVAAAVRTRVLARPTVVTWMRRFFAGTFVAMGAKLAMTRQ